MLDIIKNPLFNKFVIPLITVALGIFVKYASRNDNHKQLKREDFAFGFNVSITALILLITSSSRLALDNNHTSVTTNALKANSKLGEVPWIILAMFIGLWGLSTLVRKKGWLEDGKNTMVVGVIIPDVVGIVFLLFVVGWTN